MEEKQGTEKFRQRHECVRCGSEYESYFYKKHTTGYCDNRDCFALSKIKLDREKNKSDIIEKKNE